MGLNGKAVLPMVLGLGCDTMATMTTRILETRKERLLVTLLLALGVPCSAQLGVVPRRCSAAFAGGRAFVLGGVVAVVMIAVGWLAARLLPGERGDFVLELPPMRLPQLSNVASRPLARVEWYLQGGAARSSSSARSSCSCSTGSTCSARDRGRRARGHGLARPSRRGRRPRS